MRLIVIVVTISWIPALPSCRNIDVTGGGVILENSEDSKQPISFAVSKNKYSVKVSTFLVHGESKVLNLNKKSYANFSSKGVIFIPSLKCYVFGTEKSGINFVNLVYAIDNRHLKISTAYSFPNFIGEEQDGRQVTTLESVIKNKLIFKRIYRGEDPITVSYYEVDIKKFILSSREPE